MKEFTYDIWSVLNFFRFRKLLSYLYLNLDSKKAKKTPEIIRTKNNIQRKKAYGIHITMILNLLPQAQTPHALFQNLTYCR